MWVWGLIRSGMKAVVDYIFQNSQFLHIFLQYFIKNLNILGSEPLERVMKEVSENILHYQKYCPV